jgi:hypothetical protein
MMESGQQLEWGQTLILREGLQNMAKELMGLCDNIERHGLIDYQYRVWEEQIMDSRCSPFSLYEYVLLTTCC